MIVYIIDNCSFITRSNLKQLQCNLVGGFNPSEKYVSVFPLSRWLLQSHAAMDGAQLGVLKNMSQLG